LLINLILKNHDDNEKGMPLGNLTSQFFANVYLNDLDYFIKHKLKSKYYIRYVDDFVLLHENKEMLKAYKEKIEKYLKNLKLELHPQKSHIFPLYHKIDFLGFRIFYHYRLLRKRNIKQLNKKLIIFKENYGASLIDYEQIINSIDGWFAYATWANTYKLRNQLKIKIQEYFPNEFSARDIRRHLQ